MSAEARQVHKQELVSPQVKNPEISGKTAKAILAGMALLPQKRPQSVSDWLNQLGVQKQSPAPQPNPVNWSKWQTIWAVVAILVSLFVGIPSWLALNKPDSSPIPQPTGSPQLSPTSSPIP